MRKALATILISACLSFTAWGPFPEPSGPVTPAVPPDQSAELAKARKLSLKRLRGWRRSELARLREHNAYRRAMRRRWAPTVDYALRLASVVYSVPLWQLRHVAWCESRNNPLARNGRYLGLMQLGWAPFGFSPFDPVASALSAAQTVRRDGSWRQWTCAP